MSTNTYWYLMLLLVSVLLWAVIYYKKKQKGSWILFLITVEIVYLFETLFSIFLRCYEYSPKIILYDRYYDNNVGAMFSNFISVPTSATFITILRLKFKWKVFFVLVYAGVELLFLSLHIYRHFWWRTEYTSLGLLICFLLAEKTYQKLKQPLKGLWHSIFLFLCIAPLEGTVHILPIMIFCNRVYNVPWFDNTGRNTTAFASIYYLVLAAIMVAIIKAKIKHKILKYLLLISIILAANFILESVDILDSLVWWDYIIYAFLPLLVLKAGEFISRKLEKAPLAGSP